MSTQPVAAPAKEPLSLDRLEELVYTQKYEKAFHLLLKIITALEEGGGLVPRVKQIAEKNQGEQEALGPYTRLATCISALMAAPGVGITEEAFDSLSFVGPSIGLVFPCSAYKTPTHVLRWLGIQSADNHFQLDDEQKLKKFLLLYSLYTNVTPDFEALFAQYPHIILPVYLATLATRAVMTEEVDRKREELLKLRYLLENAELNDLQSKRLTSAWMYCSYAHSEDKHHLKLHLNAMLRRWMTKKGVQAQDLAPHVQKSRPRMVIPAEVFTHKHAMYRCYAPAIRQLKNHFELILLAEERCIDDVTKALFDDFVAVDYEEQDIVKLVAQVRALQADIIYYPSLGMNAWTLALANQRLAPIQLFTLGHPATSCSPFIDYVVVEEVYFGDVRCFSEKVVLMPNGSLQYEHLDLDFPVTPELRPAPETIRIAIASRSFKISAPFLKVCREIQKQTQRNIEFHIFPNENGLLLYAIKQELKQALPDSTLIVYESSNYTEYLKNLSQCDLHFQTFPFGGTNSNADSVRLGLPMLAMEGMEPHSRTDLPFLKFIGMPEWLAAKNEQDYINAALHLIHNDEVRIGLGQQLLNSNIEQALFDSEFKVRPAYFLQTIQAIYQAHEQIQANGQQLWTLETLHKLLGKTL